jgi:hypothetical protein
MDLGRRELWRDESPVRLSGRALDILGRPSAQSAARTGCFKVAVGRESIMLIPEFPLTLVNRDGALQSLQRGMSIMPEIVDDILRIFAGELDSDFLEASREKVSRYIETLASTGKDPLQLTEYGLAYLKELHNPDPRYTGC